MNFYDIIYFVVLGFMYILLVNKLVEVVYKNSPAKIRIQNELATYFIIGVISIIMAETVFSKYTRFNNQIVRKALIFGGSLMILYSTLINWDKLSEEIKLLIFVVVFISIIWYAYKYQQKGQQKIKKTKKEKISE